MWGPFVSGLMFVLHNFHRNYRMFGVICYDPAQKAATMTLFLMTNKEMYKETSKNPWSDRDLADIHGLTGEQMIFSLHALKIIAVITITYWFSESDVFTLLCWSNQWPETQRLFIYYHPKISSHLSSGNWTLSDIVLCKMTEIIKT